MKIKEGLEISTDDFWYDLTAGGYLDPDEICVNQDDADKVNKAIEIIQDFEDSCEKSIDGFVR